MSNASGSFGSGTTALSGTANISGGTGTFVATIPSSVAGGSAYKIRVNATGVTGTGDQSVTVNNVAVAPVADQNIVANVNGNQLTATETPAANATSREWFYGTTSGSYPTATGITTSTFTPNFATAGTYYVVVKTTFATCGPVTSNQVRINVTAPTPIITLSSNTALGFTAFTGTPSASQSYTVTGSNLTTDINIVSPTGYELALEATPGTPGTFAAYPTGTPLVLTQSGGSVSAVVYVRLAGTTSGSFGTSGSPSNIAHTSTGASLVNKPVYGTVTNPSITGVVLTPAAVCTTSGAGSTSVAFTGNGTPGTYTVQLSDASGSFATPLATATGTASPILLAVPQGTASGTGYRVQVVNGAVSSALASLQVVNAPTVSISPNTTQSLVTGVNGNPLSATETPAAASRVWQVGSSATGAFTNISPAQTGTTYTPNFATAGTYFVRVVSTFAACSDVASAPVQIDVANPAPTLTALSTSSGTTGTTVSIVLTGTGFTTASVVNFNNTTVTPTFTSATSLTVSFTLPATAGNYPITVSNPTPGGGTSGTQTFTVTTGPLLTYKTIALSGSTFMLPVATVVTNLSATSISRSSDLNQVSTNGAYASSGFPSSTTVADATKGYLTFSYTVAGGYTATISNIALRVYRTSSGPQTIELRASTDGTNFSNPLILGTQTLPSAVNTGYSFSPPATSILQASSGTVYFRLYGYNGSTGNFRLEDSNSTTPAVIVNGTIDPITTPEINVVQGLPATDVLNNGSYTYSDTRVGNNTSTQFSIQNQGAATLVLSSGSPVVNISGNTADFSLTQPTATTVAANSSLPFTITFAPTSTGTKTATISIASNDSDENPYTFTVTGTGVTAPLLTSFSPVTGPVGTAVTLTGTDFTATSAVSFNGTAATAVTFNSTTSLTATVPTGATTGPLTVTTAYGSSTSTASFTVTATPTAGQLLLEDNFAYAAGQSLTNHGWIGFSTTTSTPPATVADNLTMAQYPRGFDQSEPATFAGSSTARLSNVNNQDVSRTFGATSSSTLYAAAVINVTATASGGDYFLAFADAANAVPRGRIFIARTGTAAAGTFQFGVGNGSTGNYTTGTPYNSNTPYLVVLKYTVNSNNTQTASLFVYNAAADLNEPAQPLISSSGPLSSGLGALANIILRQADNGLGVDGVRVATNWGTVIGRPVYVDETTTLQPGSYYSVAVNGNTSLTTTGPASVEGPVSLNGGKINTDATNLLSLTATASITGGSTTSFVNGPLARATAAGARTTVFPIGSGTLYRPLTLTATAQTGTATYTAFQTENNTSRTLATGGSLPNLTRVSTKRFYTVNTSNTSSGFTGNITLTFGPDDYINNPSNTSLVIAKRDGGTSGGWLNIGRATTNASTGPDNGAGGAASAGTLTSDNFSGFSDFTFGATDDISNVNVLQAVNPLPVQLSSFGAQRQADKAVAVKWSTATEKNADRFEVQRSLNAHDFVTVATAKAQGTSSKAAAYAVLDQTAPAATLYYRLRQVDGDGTVAFSPVVTVAGTGETAKVLLYPNPTRSSLSFIAAAPTPYRVLNQLGQALLAGTTEAGTAKVNVETLPAGLYFIELQTPAGRSVQKFEKE
ncbi:choice-of-anchor D domain-containing protein [Hymenobacter convexus]|uniref:choice-of-anchor D domain-containing protein n=1 Tax=Hymenobacter sp. CA1UV-4 TaxID=3063782 RepID=UPI0027124EDC|nr:choice-of-anchor D domain-containing protein [Hymenobacter sp. CA1UV-4]MDO7851291.1 choice-of-anchor D domain-containing protein [Hymenobacter sp. CA1UV-4]